MILPILLKAAGTVMKGFGKPIVALRTGFPKAAGVKKFYGFFDDVCSGRISIGINGNFSLLRIKIAGSTKKC